ncbi:RNA polymerase sigma-70 factor [Chitinophaga rhizophila]|uniref:RNA polymerase sigma-70 factor n=1 Tax=Chitinophaga rhizophila TaxID=2866212 RepID=A0ABS7G6K9_9BACT|nr:RNA polymerase sigma-70 factor [Chitinophaga rhizophila]MBW8683292.1 RNA polymerase sigma-70 factor [Chitinophaga rhizophila]
MSTFSKISALKEGDSSVFSDLFHEYHRKVYFYVLAKTHSSYIAEETTQITFIKLWNYRQQLDESMPVSRLIFHIARATFIDLLRKEAVKDRYLEQEQSAGTDNSSTFDIIQSKELLLRIKELVQAMPPMRRKVFELSRYEFKSYKEIAEQLSLSVKTVENHMSLALSYLRNLLLLLLLLLYRY